ncbi:MAG: hypothetical protein OXP12_09740, partial [Thaumarchaeota archaeon]|nr:hypothetical protein [Nitrososphaerota archaeon]
MSRAGRGRSAKTDNKKYVERGAALIIEYDPEWEDDVRRANEGKVGAPYRYAETLIMLAAGVYCVSLYKEDDPEVLLQIRVPVLFA